MELRTPAKSATPHRRVVTPYMGVVTPHRVVVIPSNMNVITPDSPESVSRRPVPPSIRRLTPLRSPRSILPISPLTHLKHLTRGGRHHSWHSTTPEWARGLEWDNDLGLSPESDMRWGDSISPLKGSPARRLFSWAFDGEFAALQGELEEDDVFPLKDLDNNVCHTLQAKEYDSLPAVIGYSYLSPKPRPN